MTSPPDDAPPKGPFLAAAVFCRSAKDNKDGSFTLGNIHYAVQLPPPATGDSVTYDPVVFIQFKAGGKVGPAKLGLHFRGSLAEPLPPIEIEMVFHGPNSVATFGLKVPLQGILPGYTFVDVFLDDVFFSRMVLEVQFGFPPLGKMRMN